MAKWLFALTALGCLLITAPVQAQTYPTKPVTIVVTAAAGGVSDVMARALGLRLSEMWGQQVVIENRGGGGHILGAQAVAKAAPDGHTLMLAEAGAYVINPIVFPKDKQPYDLDKDLVQITGLVRIHHALIASPDLPANNFGELIALAKSKPGEVTYGTAGVGSGPHLNIALLEHITGIKMVAVHYRGATPALTDVIGGHTKTMLISVASGVPPMQAGKVKMLAVGSPKRLAKLPDIPAAAETVPGYLAGTWFGLSTTAGSPRAVVTKINADVRKILDDPAFQEKILAAQLFEPMASSPEEFSRFIKEEQEKWTRVIREQNLNIVH